MSRIESGFKLLGVVICLIFMIIPEINLAVEWTLVAVILLTVGIPHGAIDHLLSNPQLERKSFIGFLFRYILLIVLYLGLWYIAPIPALIAFLVMSSYHFGQSHFLNQDIPEKMAWSVYGLRGAYFLSAILLGDLEATRNILGPIVEVIIPTEAKVWIVVGFGIATVMSQFLFGPKLKLNHLLEIVILAPLLFFSPLLVGFVVYFGFWHSVPSMMVEYAYLKKFSFSDTPWKFGIQLLPFSVISIIGIGILLGLGLKFLSGQELILMFFVLISLISFPHILYMDGFLKSQNQN